MLHLSRCALRTVTLRSTLIRIVKPREVAVWKGLLNIRFSPLMGSFISSSSESSSETKPMSSSKVTFTENELKQKLTPMQYHVTQEKGTERAFTGKLTYNKEKGIYSCIVCGHELFKSDHKFDSGSGWPSFHEVMNSDAVETHTDMSHGMKRVEVTCKQCGSHLGHVFDDGPLPSGQRYCINSASLKFDEKKKSEL